MTTNIDQNKSFTVLKDSLTTFQNSLHKPEDISRGSEYEGNNIMSIFYPEYKKTTWYYKFSEPLQASSSSETDTFYIFKAKSNAHGLLSTDLSQKLPSIECNPGYLAKWTHNVGLNVVESGTFCLNDNILQTIDSGYNDCVLQFCASSGRRDEVSLNLGNIPQLQEYQSILPKFTTSYKLPWYYSEDPSKVFPMYYCGLFDRVEHKMVLKRRINDLLEIKDINGNRVPADHISLKKIDGVAVTPNMLYLPPPQMYGTYIYLSDMECEYNRERCIKSDDGSTSHKKNVFYIKDMIKIEDENPSRLGNIVNIDIKNIDYPIIKLYWTAHNQSSYYSNYSTNSEDHRLGWSPLEEVSLNWGKSYIFRNMPAHRFERILPICEFSSTPLEPGYGGWSMGVDIRESGPLPGILFRDGQFSVKLNDTNPYINLDPTAQRSTDFYKVSLYLVYIKKLTFDTYPLDEKSRQSIGAQISISGGEM